MFKVVRAVIVTCLNVMRLLLMCTFTKPAKTLFLFLDDIIYTSLNVKVIDVLRNIVSKNLLSNSSWVYLYKFSGYGKSEIDVGFRCSCSCRVIIHIFTVRQIAKL